MDLQKIEFLKGAEDLTPFTEGYGGAEKFVFTKGGKKFFMKVGKFPHCPDLEKLFSSAGICHPKIVDSGKIDGENSYIIEEFIDGKNLKAVSKWTESKFVYEFGFRMGAQFRNLRKVYKDKPIDQKSYDRFCQEVDKRIARLTRHKEEVLGSLSASQVEFIDYILSFLSGNKDLIKNNIMVFGHNDVKMGNFMVSGDQVYAVDFESVHYIMPAYACIWSVARDDFEDDKHHAFANGWLDALFNFDIPECVLQSLNFIYFFNMSNYCSDYLKAKDFARLDKLIDYIKARYYVDGELHLDKVFRQVGKMADFPRLKGCDFYLLSGSYSPVNYAFKCEGKGKQYFLKVMRVGRRGYENAMNCYRMLQSCDIPMPKLHAHGMCEGEQACYALFDFVPYPELDEGLTTAAEAQRRGAKVSSYLMRLCDKSVPTVPVYSISEISGEVHRLLDVIFEKKDRLPFLPWTKDDLLGFESSLIKSFEGETLVLIHDDVKSGNILYGPSGEIVFVDNETLMMSYQTINFQWIIKECFIGASAWKHQNIALGYLHQIYGGKLPDRIKGQIKYLLLLKLARDVRAKRHRTTVSERTEALFDLCKRYIENKEEIEWLK